MLLLDKTSLEMLTSQNNNYNEPKYVKPKSINKVC